MINFTELYDKTIDDLFAFGVKISSDRELTKDCIQDVFVKLYSKQDELDGIEKIESYLYVALKNKINDEFRRNSHISNNKIDECAAGLVNGNDDTSLLERKEEELKRIKEIDKFMSNLSPRQQQIINLYYMEQRKYDDICRIMGINYQSVRNLMHRSMFKLRLIATKTKAV